MTERLSSRRPAAVRPVVRRGPSSGSMGRSRRIRRASGGLSPVRAGAILALLLSAAGIYGVANSSAFAYTDLRLEGAAYTDPAAVEEALDTARGENLFLVRTAPLADAVRSLPTVRDVSVGVRLPDTLVVSVRERDAILVWRIGARRYLVDPDGRLFARLGADQPVEAAGLPVVDDRRAASAGLSIGRSLDPVDLDAATRLASLVPSDVGSEAETLAVQVTDANGFVLRGRSYDWAAIFGFYTQSLRTPEIIPGQVRLLRSLLIGREPLVSRVVLASETDGTYFPKPTPTPVPSASATPAP